MRGKTKKKSTKPLRVFEAFAGIGAQHSALKRANVNFEIVGISEWFINALLTYDAIHNNEEENIDIPSYEEQIEYLSKFTFSKDSVNPIKDNKKLSRNEIENLYIANKRTKNFGSITEIKGKDLPRIDLLVYSFPCQDLSTGGKSMGMSKGSGTRSGLLREIERILKELKKLNRLPEYLLMENVKTIYAQSNKKDLEQWLSFLESIGYVNGSHLTLNAIDFGIPQFRNRAFIISHLNSPVDDSSLITYSKPAPSIKPFLRLNYKKYRPLVIDYLHQIEKINFNLPLALGNSFKVFLDVFGNTLEGEGFFEKIKNISEIIKQKLEASNKKSTNTDTKSINSANIFKIKKHLKNIASKKPTDLYTIK